jgi:hypothetical protein
MGQKEPYSDIEPLYFVIYYPSGDIYYSVEFWELPTLKNMLEIVDNIGKTLSDKELSLFLTLEFDMLDEKNYNAATALSHITARSVTQ